MRTLMPLPAAAIVLLASCAPRIPAPVVAERFVTASDPALNIDSVATYTGADNSWLFATAKEGDLLRIYDATSGAALRDLGSAGTGPDQFERPNGILVAGDLLVVVERDNRRVQIFALPGLQSIARFGEAELVLPYGAWLEPDGADRWRLFVTDNYETAEERVPPPEELDHRVHVYALTVERGAAGNPTGVLASHERSFGATSGEGVLRIVESLWGDPDYDRLLVAEEDPDGGRVIKIYSLDGRFTGPVIGDGIFRTQPEGIALFECADGSGYWITTDQDRGRNVFHLFDRRTLSHLGGFAGAVTQNTDGIWLNQSPLPGFPAGAFFAVHDDQAVAAFDWRDVAAAVGVAPTCA
jgi:3-phytase